MCLGVQRMAELIRSGVFKGVSWFGEKGKLKFTHFYWISNMLYSLYIWKNWEDLNGLTTSSHPHSAPIDKVPWSSSTPYHMDQVQFLLIPEWKVSVSCHAAELFTQTNHILLWKSRGTSTSWYYKACLT